MRDPCVYVVFWAPVICKGGLPISAEWRPKRFRAALDCSGNPGTSNTLLPGPKYAERWPSTSKTSPKGHHFAYFWGPGRSLLHRLEFMSHQSPIVQESPYLQIPEAKGPSCLEAAILFVWSRPSMNAGVESSCLMKGLQQLRICVQV